MLSCDLVAAGDQKQCPRKEPNDKDSDSEDDGVEPRFRSFFGEPSVREHVGDFRHHAARGSWF